MHYVFDNVIYSGGRKKTKKKKKKRTMNHFYVDESHVVLAQVGLLRGRANVVFTFSFTIFCFNRLQLNKIQ